MKFKHAFWAGLGARARLRPTTHATPDAGKYSEIKNEAAGHQLGTTAAIGTQHLDFASLEQSAPAKAHPIKAKLIGWASWLATVLRGLA